MARPTEDPGWPELPRLTGGSEVGRTWPTPSVWRGRLSRKHLPVVSSVDAHPASPIPRPSLDAFTAAGWGFPRPRHGSSWVSLPTCLVWDTPVSKTPSSTFYPVSRGRPCNTPRDISTDARARTCTHAHVCVPSCQMSQLEWGGGTLTDRLRGCGAASAPGRVQPEEQRPLLPVPGRRAGRPERPTLMPGAQLTSVKAQLSLGGGYSSSDRMRA